MFISLEGGMDVRMLRASLHFAQPEVVNLNKSSKQITDQMNSGCTSGSIGILSQNSMHGDLRFLFEELTSPLTHFYGVKEHSD